MPIPDLPKVTIYIDGACSPNPGPGGWAAILVFPNQEPKELVVGELATTSNRMELKATLEALLSLATPHRVHLYTDSEYLKNGITEWLPLWEKRNWQTVEKTDVKNQEFWQPLLAQLERHHVTWHWVKDNSGSEWDEKADYLARSEIPKPELPLNDEQAIHIFTAASYFSKRKQGGWGVVLKYRDKEKLLSGGVADTSSNRMHLQAAIEGLKAVKAPFPIHIYTTSEYLRDGATMWTKKWMRRNWKTQHGKSVSHRDLWVRLTELVGQYQVNWHVVSKKDMPSEIPQAKDLAYTAASSR